MSDLTGAPERQEAADLSDIHGLPRRETMLVLVGVMLAVLLAAIDQTIVGTAMPRIVADLHGFEQYAWVFTAYMVASTTIVPAAGRLSDLHGRKPFLVAAVIIFLVGSIAAGASQSMPQLIAMRVVQGLGAGLLMANAFTVIGDLFPPAERGKYQGITAGVFGIASVVGPLAGGVITDQFSWRWVFYVNLPLGLVVLFVLIRYFPALRPARRSRPIDFLGLAALTLSVVPLLLAVSFAGGEYAWNSPQVLGLLAIFLVMAVLFVLVERRAAEPIVPLDLFGNRVVGISLLVTLLTGFGMFGAILFVPLYIQGVLGVSATDSGKLLTVLTVGTVFGSVASGQALSRLGGHYRIQALVGLALMAFGTLLLSTMDSATPVGEAVRNLMIVGLGLGTLMPLFTIAVQNAVPYERLGVATSVTQFFRSIGGTIGVAALGSVMTARFGDAFLARLPDAVRNASGAFDVIGLARNPQALISPDARAELDLAIQQLGGGNAEVTRVVVQALRDGLAVAIHDVFLIGTAVTVVAWVACLFLPELPLRRSHRSAEMPSRARPVGLPIEHGGTRH